MMDRPWSQTSVVGSAYRSAFSGVAAGAVLTLGLTAAGQGALRSLFLSQAVPVQKVKLSDSIPLGRISVDYVEGMREILLQEPLSIGQIKHEIPNQRLTPHSTTSQSRTKGSTNAEVPQVQPMAPSQGPIRLTKKQKHETRKPEPPEAPLLGLHAVPNVDEATPIELSQWSQKREFRIEIYQESVRQAETRPWAQLEASVFSKTYQNNADSLALSVHPSASAGLLQTGASYANTQWFAAQTYLDAPEISTAIVQTQAAPLRQARQETTETESRSLAKSVVIRPTAPEPKNPPSTPKVPPARKELPVVFRSDEAPSNLLAARQRADSSNAMRAVQQDSVDPIPSSPATLRLSIQQLNTQPHRSALEGQVVPVVATSVWSYEGWSHRSKEGWIVTTSGDHWPSLSWHKAGSVSAPRLVSHREASVMAALVGTTIQPSAGLVFGEVPAGYRVEFSGRSDEAIYWVSGKGQLSTHDYSQARSFALLNAEPGMHLVHLVHAWTGERIPVAAAIVGGYSTFLDLSKVRRVGVRGRIALSSAKRFEPAALLQVSRVGDSTRSVFSNKAGEFKLDHILVAGELPIFIEYFGKDFPHPHRVKVSLGTSDLVEAGELFAISSQRVSQWLEQLEGGVSPESGLVLSAWRHSSQKLEDSGAGPVVHPLDASVEIEPETYFVGTRDDLNVQGVMRRGITTALSTQLVPGLHKVEVRFPYDHEPIWSEIAIASPGVITTLRSGYAD